MKSKKGTFQNPKPSYDENPMRESRKESPLYVHAALMTTASVKGSKKPDKKREGQKLK